MRLQVYLASLILLLFLSCATTKYDAKNVVESEIKPTTQELLIVKDTVPKVTGIGGIFFKSENPDSLRQWYGNNLGLAIHDFGSPFEFRNAHRPDEINYLTWGPFNEEADYFDPSEREFMINYRVQNIEGLIRNLEATGIKVLDTIAQYPYGKFVHIMDPFGNKVEFWEPNDAFFTQMGGATTK